MAFVSRLLLFCRFGFLSCVVFAPVASVHLLYTSCLCVCNLVSPRLEFTFLSSVLTFFSLHLESVLVPGSCDEVLVLPPYFHSAVIAWLRSPVPRCFLPPVPPVCCLSPCMGSVRSSALFGPVSWWTPGSGPVQLFGSKSGFIYLYFATFSLIMLLFYSTSLHSFSFPVCIRTAISLLVVFFNVLFFHFCSVFMPLFTIPSSLMEIFPPAWRGLIKSVCLSCPIRGRDSGSKAGQGEKLVHMLDMQIN